ncbi:MAG: hypothetical protein IKN27_00865, partial [Selenomonadaceae bacterium]|nr:hypothetical protein [Selenomonadaceae bacterium]
TLHPICSAFKLSNVFTAIKYSNLTMTVRCRRKFYQSSRVVQVLRRQRDVASNLFSIQVIERFHCD